MASSFKGICIGVGTVLFLFLSASLGFVFMQAPFIPLLWLMPSAYKMIMDSMISVWLLLPPTLSRVVYGTRIRVFGSSGHFPHKGWNLIIMNHRTRLDWYFLWLTFLHQPSPLAAARALKIVLKASLRNLPGFGWAMQVSRFLFLDRSWEKDKEHMTHFLEALSHEGNPNSILIFPEGTDLEPNSLASSHKFAKKLGLPLYQHVLHPRVTGTVHAMKTMITSQALERVVNVTVFYPDFVPEHETCLLRGKHPKEVWYFVDPIPLEDIPGASDVTHASSFASQQLREPETNNNDSEASVLANQADEKLAAFIKDVWEHKEAMLDTLHTERPSDPGSEQWPEVTLPPPSTAMLVIVIALWVSFICVSVYGLYSSMLLRLYLLLVTTSTLWVSARHGGLDKLEVATLHASRHTPITTTSAGTSGGTTGGPAPASASASLERTNSHIHSHSPNGVQL